MKVKTKVKMILFSSLLLTFTVKAQNDSAPFSKQLLFSEDNDFINIRGHGTDKAYTHGFRMDALYTKKLPSRLFIDKWIPKAGGNSDVTYGWSLLQTMITPKDLTKSISDSSDYRYASSITGVHTLYSINSLKNFAVGTELLIGVMGAPSLGEETQMGMHQLIKGQLPRGWNSELKTALLMNVNFLIERKIIPSVKHVELIGGIKSYIGTSMNALTIYSLVRIGKMSPYFDNVIHRYAGTKTGRKSWQLYAVARPSLDLVLHNALIQGALFRKDAEIHYNNGEPTTQISHRTLKHMGISLDYGVVMTKGGFSISFTQRTMYAMIREQRRHEVGNISLYFILN